jgi:hypothetical protein
MFVITDPTLLVDGHVSHIQIFHLELLSLQRLDFSERSIRAHTEDAHAHIVLRHVDRVVGSTVVDRIDRPVDFERKGFEI